MKIARTDPISISYVLEINPVSCLLELAIHDLRSLIKERYRYVPVGINFKPPNIDLFKNSSSPNIHMSGTGTPIGPRLGVRQAFPGAHTEP